MSMEHARAPMETAADEADEGVPTRLDELADAVGRVVAVVVALTEVEAGRVTAVVLGAAVVVATYGAFT